MAHSTQLGRHYYDYSRSNPFYPALELDYEHYKEDVWQVEKT